MEKEIRICAPEGYVVDNEKSTRTNIVFKLVNFYNWRDIKSYDDACRVLPVPNDYLNINKKHIVAQLKLEHIIYVINQDWKPDYTNNNQKKWYPYFNADSCFGFFNAGYYYDALGANTGSRFCLESQEKAEYCGKTFTKLYEEYLM